MSEFKIGDKVRCFSDEYSAYFTKDKYYKVIDVRDNLAYVIDNTGDKEPVDNWREVLEQTPPLPTIQEVAEELGVILYDDGSFLYPTDDQHGNLILPSFSVEQLDRLLIGYLWMKEQREEK